MKKSNFLNLRQFKVISSEIMIKLLDAWQENISSDFFLIVDEQLSLGGCESFKPKTKNLDQSQLFQWTLHLCLI